MPEEQGDNLAAEITALFLALSVDLLRYGEQLRQVALATMIELELELARELLDANLSSIKNIAARQKRQTALLLQTRKTIASAYNTIGSDLNAALPSVAEIASAGAGQVINLGFTKDVASVITSEERLKAIVGKTLTEGSPAKEWWAKQAADTQMRVASQIRLGLLQGETNDQIITRIIGKSTGRMLKVVDAEGKTKRYAERVGGIVDLSRRDAGSIVLTASAAVGNEAYLETYKANQDILRGVQAIVTLDLRTTPLCRGRSGFAWDFEGNPLPGTKTNIKFPGPPPWHMRCRTVLAPVIKSIKSILNDEPDLGPIIREGTRASMDGQVAADMEYEDWLKTRSKAEQIQVLGQGRWDLWNAGKLTLVDLIDQKGNPISLAELRKKYGKP